MKVIPTPLRGLVIIEPRVFADNRGYFFEAFNKKLLHQSGISVDFVQENQSRSKKNTIRGLHFQREPFAQTKLVRVIHGTIIDAVVDLRSNEPTFKQTFSLEISSDRPCCLLVPKGFAHGYSVLSDFAEIVYACDNYYFPEHEAGILHSDPTLKIDWKVDRSASVVSEKDLRLPLLADLKL